MGAVPEAQQEAEVTAGRKKVGGVRSQSSVPRSAFPSPAVTVEKRRWEVIHDSESSADREAQQRADADQAPCYVMRVTFKDGSSHFSVIDDEVWLMCGKHSRGVHLRTFYPSEAQNGTTTEKGADHSDCGGAGY